MQELFTSYLFPYSRSSTYSRAVEYYYSATPWQLNTSDSPIKHDLCIVKTCLYSKIDHYHKKPLSVYSEFGTLDDLNAVVPLLST